MSDRGRGLDDHNGLALDGGHPAGAGLSSASMVDPLDPGTSNGPTEAINGHPEHLRGITLGFRHLTHYIARSLLEACGFKQHLHR